MNAKRVKRIRAELRKLGHDPKDVNHLSGRPRFEGMPGTVVLDPRCGRAMYQAAKQAART